MRTILEGLFVALIGVAALQGSMQVPASTVGETWAGLVPLCISVALLVVGGCMAGKGLRGKKYERPVSWAIQWAPSRTSLEVYGLVVLSIGYHQAITFFGYLLPTVVVAPVALLIFGVRSPFGLALSMILCPLFFYGVFFVLLGVVPPYGEVIDFFNLIRH